MNSMILSLVALIPAVLLCWYIYRKDRIEKEPILLLLLLFVMGALSYLPTIGIENRVIGLMDQMFASEISYSLTGVANYASDRVFVSHSLARGFLAIAFVEELIKWFLLWLFTAKNKDFDHLFDGVVYAVFLSLGFAAMENVFYAVRDGWATFVLRSLTSVPGHMTFGVLMGFCYTMWHTSMIARKREKELASKGIIDLEKPFNSMFWMVACLICPLLLHGCYSFLEMFASDVMTIVFYVFVILLYGVCFYLVHQLSDADNSDDHIAERMIKKKYPHMNQNKQK